jgi:beta-barrel assembly-enhancing protease
MATLVWHYDGVTAVRQAAEFVIEGDSFRLQFPERATDLMLIESLIHRGVKNGGPVYGLKDRQGWQVGFEGDIPDALEARLPRPPGYGSWIDRIGFVPAVGGFLVISALVLFGVLTAPQYIAPFVPLTWEKKLGDAMIGDMGGRICHGPGGQPALDALVGRINGGRSDIRVQVANIAMVNAVALPGGNIVVFRGLLEEAQSGNEIAGVLGHEIGHVRNRDVMQALLRQAGLSVLMGGIDGNAGGYLNAMVSATYSREAEAAADAYSIGAMSRAAVDPEDTAKFFARMAKDEERLGPAKAALGYLSSHPLSEDREKKFRQSKVAGAAYRDALTAEQWAALIKICENDPDVSEDRGLFF